MSAYKQPIGQKRLTNIALVRLKKAGQRFEVACYKNKVMSWRAGIEKDIDEVLQVHTIFSHVGKGTLAKAADLIKAFGTDDEDVVCRKILAEGEYQVSDKEREAAGTSVHRDVLSLVRERTVNPDTLRPYSLGMLEKYAHEVHFAVDPVKSSKQQALDLIRQLVAKFPIVRAQMELRLTLPTPQADSDKTSALQSQLDTWQSSVTQRSTDAAAGTSSVVFRVDPSKYREIDAWAQSVSARLEVLTSAVQAGNDLAFDNLEHVEDGMSSLGLQGQVSQSQPQDAGQSASGGQQQAEHARAQSPLDAAPDNGRGDAELISGAGIPREGASGAGVKKVVTPAPGTKCTTCACQVQSREAYREHCKSEWHKHNMRRKTRGLAPLSAEDCELDLDLGGSRSKDDAEYF